MTGFPACPANFNLAAHALQHAQRLSDKVALEILLGERTETMTYGQLERALRGIGTGLLQSGLRPGDRVLLRLGNSMAFPLAFLGAIAAGLVPVPTSAALTGPEITRLAALILPKAVIAGPGLALPDGATAMIGLAELEAMHALPACDWSMGPPDRAAYIVFTSGTSGQSLPVVHAHRALWARGMMHDGWEGLTQSDRLLHAGALNWTYTLGTGLLDPWVKGATALIPAPDTPSAALPGLLARHRATIIAAAPGVFRQMLRTTFPPLPDLRHGLSAGEALPAPLRATWRTVTGTDLHEALGLTECSTFLSGSPARPAPEGYTGYAQAGRRVAVLTEDGTVLAPGAEGLLAIHRSDPGLMLGYADAAQETESRFVGDWFLTGDLVHWAADGAFRHLGRADDIMNPGGFRIAPQEIEATLASFAGLTEVAVAEVEVRPGTRIIACGYVAPEDLNEADLADHAARGLAPYKVPRIWQRLDHLPRNANNKLNRRALRASLQSLLPRET